MTTIVKQHLSTTTGNKPGDLEPGQIAVHPVDHFIYVGNGSGTKISATGATITPAPTAGMGWVEYQFGKPNFHPIEVLTADRTFGLDANGCHFASATTNVTTTIPADATADLPVGSEFFISREDTGTVSFAREAGVTFLGDTTPLVLGELAYIKKMSANSWRIWRFSAITAFAQEQILPGTGGNIPWNFEEGATAIIDPVSADTSITVTNVPNTPDGTISFTQDATGGRVITLTNGTFDTTPCLAANSTSVYKVVTVAGVTRYILQNPANLLDPTVSAPTYSNQVGDFVDLTFTITHSAASDPAYQFDGILVRLDTGTQVANAVTTPNAILPGGNGTMTFTSIEGMNGATPISFELQVQGIC